MEVEDCRIEEERRNMREKSCKDKVVAGGGFLPENMRPESRRGAFIASSSGSTQNSKKNPGSVLDSARSLGLQLYC